MGNILPWYAEMYSLIHVQMLSYIWLIKVFAKITDTFPI